MYWYGSLEDDYIHLSIIIKIFCTIILWAYFLLLFVCSMKMDLQMFQKDKYTMEYDC